jgi:hypothetical protein
VVVFRANNTIRTEAYDGRLLGSIPVPADTIGAPIAEIAGPERLLLTCCGAKKMRIVDYTGKEIASFAPPTGWGFRRSWSHDGRRVLFDNYTRTSKLMEKAMEAIANVAVPVPEESNGESIEVVDITSGAMSFRYANRNSLLGQEGQMHADLSPSGQLVGVATLSKFAIYEIPDQSVNH